MSLKMVTSVPFKKREELVDELTQKLENAIDNIEKISDIQLYQAIADLGFLNDLAFKGYRKLKDEWRDLNDSIYDLKNTAVYTFANEFKKRGLDVSYGTKEKVIYFRRDDGIQISFHVPKLTSEEMALYSSLPIGIWDRVEHAYSFTDIQEYRLIIDQRNKAETIAIEIANKHKDQNIEIVIRYLRTCSLWRLANIYRIDPKSDIRTYLSKMEGYSVRPIIYSYNSNIIVRDALGKFEKKYFDEVDYILKELGLPFKFDRKNYKLTQTKMGKISIGKPKTTSTRNKVA